MAASLDRMAPDAVEATLDYESPVPVFDSGAEAAEHGLKALHEPSQVAQQIILKVERRRGRRER